MRLDKQKTMKKERGKVLLALWLAGGILLTGCGAKEAHTSLTIQKDGSIRSVLVEDFAKEYYDKDELQQKILKEAAAYNKNAGSTIISVEKIEVEDETARVEMTYRNVDAYTEHNGGIFFIGSPSQAVTKGFDLNVVLSSVSHPEETIGEADIIGMSDATLLITDQPDPVCLNGKAAYISGNAQTDKTKRVITVTQDNGKPAYVLYR